MGVEMSIDHTFKFRCVRGSMANCVSNGFLYLLVCFSARTKIYIQVDEHNLPVPSHVSIGAIGGMLKGLLRMSLYMAMPRRTLEAKFVSRSN